MFRYKWKILIVIYSIVSFAISVADDPMQERIPGEASSDDEEEKSMIFFSTWFMVSIDCCIINIIDLQSS